MQNKCTRLAARCQGVIGAIWGIRVLLGENVQQIVSFPASSFTLTQFRCNCPGSRGACNPESGVFRRSRNQDSGALPSGSLNLASTFPAPHKPSLSIYRTRQPRGPSSSMATRAARMMTAGKTETRHGNSFIFCFLLCIALGTRLPVRRTRHRTGIRKTPQPAALLLGPRSLIRLSKWGSLCMRPA